MATLTINQKKGQFGNNPYGNMTALIFDVQADNSGFIVNTNHKEVPKAGDIIHVGELPEGFIPFGYRTLVEKEFTAGAFDVGFSYVDGVDDENHPQKDTGLFTLPTLTTKGGATAGELKVKALPKSAYLDLKVTTPTAKGNKAGHLTIIVFGMLLGHA